MKNNEYDVIVFGGGISGLCSALSLIKLGLKVLTIEKSNELGGINKSFEFQGCSFDSGYHAIDYERSLLTARFIENVLGDELNIHSLSRYIYLDQYLLPDNSDINDWPETLTKLIQFNNKTTFDGSLSSLKDIWGESYISFLLEEGQNRRK